MDVKTRVMQRVNSGFRSAVMDENSCFIVPSQLGASWEISHTLHS